MKIVVTVIFIFISFISFSQEGLVAYFPFNGSIKDVINDNEGFNFGGNFTSDRNGKDNSAYIFSDDRLDYPNISAYNQEEVSIAFWFKYDPNKYNNDDHMFLYCQIFCICCSSTKMYIFRMWSTKWYISNICFNSNIWY